MTDLTLPLNWPKKSTHLDLWLVLIGPDTNIREGLQTWGLLFATCIIPENPFNLFNNVFAQDWIKIQSFEKSIPSLYPTWGKDIIESSVLKDIAPDIKTMWIVLHHVAVFIHWYWKKKEENAAKCKQSTVIEMKRIKESNIFFTISFFSFIKIHKILFYHSQISIKWDYYQINF